MRHITKSHNGRNKYSIWKLNIATEAPEKGKDESLFIHIKPITLSSIDIQGNVKKRLALNPIYDFISINEASNAGKNKLGKLISGKNDYKTYLLTSIENPQQNQDKQGKQLASPDQWE